MKSNAFVALTLVPIFAFLVFFMVIPIFWGLGISLFDYNPLASHNEFIGLRNFSKLFEDEVFQKSFFNTIYFVFVTVTLNIALTLVLAQVICGLRRGWMRGGLRVMVFMPCVAPLVASSVVWGSLYSVKYGLFNTLLLKLGIPAHNWLGTPSTVMPAIILFTLWADMGYNIIVFSAGIDGIPSDFYEAAAIDGAGPIKCFTHITFPLLGRTLSFVITMTFISHFQMFAQFETLTRAGGMSGGPGNSALVLTMDIYRTAFKYRDMGYASAIAIALFCIIMVFTVISQRLNRVDWGY